MPQSDMNTLFRSLSRLCDLLMNFFSEVSHTHTHAHTQTGLEATRVDFSLFGEYCNSLS